MKFHEAKAEAEKAHTDQSLSRDWQVEVYRGLDLEDWRWRLRATGLLRLSLVGGEWMAELGAEGGTVLIGVGPSAREALRAVRDTVTRESVERDMMLRVLRSVV